MPVTYQSLLAGTTQLKHLPQPGLVRSRLRSDTVYARGNSRGTAPNPGVRWRRKHPSLLRDGGSSRVEPAWYGATKVVEELSGGMEPIFVILRLDSTPLDGLWQGGCEGEALARSRTHLSKALSLCSRSLWLTSWCNLVHSRPRSFALESAELLCRFMHRRLPHTRARQARANRRRGTPLDQPPLPDTDLADPGVVPASESSTAYPRRNYIVGICCRPFRHSRPVSSTCTTEHPLPSADEGPNHQRQQCLSPLSGPCAPVRRWLRGRCAPVLSSTSSSGYACSGTTE